MRWYDAWFACALGVGWEQEAIPKERETRRRRVAVSVCFLVCLPRLFSPAPLFSLHRELASSSLVSASRA